jgi:hypothetical protein
MYDSLKLINLLQTFFAITKMFSELIIFQKLYLYADDGSADQADGRIFALASHVEGTSEIEFILLLSTNIK